ncbi:MAG: hypothetical protein ACXU9U_00250 [Parachlamydiaceae bacterium]
MVFDLNIAGNHNFGVEVRIFCFFELHREDGGAEHTENRPLASANALKSAALLKQESWITLMLSRAKYDEIKNYFIQLHFDAKEVTVEEMIQLNLVKS